MVVLPPTACQTMQHRHELEVNKSVRHSFGCGCRSADTGGGHDADGHGVRVLRVRL